MILISSPEKAKIEEKSRNLPNSEVRQRIRFSKSPTSQGEDAGIASGLNVQKNEVPVLRSINNAVPREKCPWLPTIMSMQTPQVLEYAMDSKTLF